MQTIDINSLINKEQLKGALGEPEIPNVETLTNPFEKMLEKKFKKIVMSNFKPESPEMHYGLIIAKPYAILFEQKDGKSRTFNYNFEKKFLSIENRRGNVTAFEKLSTHLKKIAALWLRKPATILFEKPNPPQKPVDPRFITFLKSAGIEDPALLSKTKDIPQEIKEKLTKRILILSNLLRPIRQKKASAESDEIAEKTTKLKDLFTGMLADKYQQLLVTDISKKDPELNTTHSLHINTKEVTYIEKNEMRKNLVKFNLKTLSIKLNEQDMDKLGLDWLNEKVQELGRKLSAGKADLYKEE